MRNLEGLPTIAIEAPADFFAAAVVDYADAPTWVGELYFEMHRGTYTSQAKTKAGNRRSEVLLGEVELFATLAAQLNGIEYPAAELDEAWKTVLTLQFHDIIPGSSIAWVHQEAEAAYDQLAIELGALRDEALDAFGRARGRCTAGRQLGPVRAPRGRRDTRRSRSREHWSDEYHGGRSVDDAGTAGTGCRVGGS